jgi:hypothetical protein
VIKQFSRKLTRKYAANQIAIRTYYLQACMSAIRLVEVGIMQHDVDLVLANHFTLRKQGGKLFCELAMEAGLIYSRVLLNFLGIYRRQRQACLESRAPQQRFHESEIWIEKFPAGELLSVPKFLSIRPVGQNPQRMYWHVVRSLHASSTETAHLTHAFSGKLRPGQLRLDSLYYTCWLARKQIMAHFYRDTVALPVPEVVRTFDQDQMFCVPEA